MSFSGAPRTTASPHPEYGFDRRGRVRIDPISALLLLIAGACGLAQYLRFGYSVHGRSATGSIEETGRALLAELLQPDSAISKVLRIAVVATTVGGAALVLLAVTMVLPIDHRPLGGVALAISLLTIGTPILLLTQAAVLDTRSIDLLEGTGFGWYLAAATPVVGVLGGLRAISV